MTVSKLAGVTLGVAMLGGTVQAQDRRIGHFHRAIETPAHETLLALLQQSETTLAPFETDGCSGGLSQAWQAMSRTFPAFAEAHQSRPPWEECCVTHDRAYLNAAGALDAAQSFDARLDADVALKTCVAASSADRVEALSDIYGLSPEKITGAYQGIANAMFGAVRFGGAPCTGLPWRWGYGYPTC